MALDVIGQYRRALEALRSGVPNHDAVAALGSSQPEVEAHFALQLKTLEKGRQGGGMLISGGFGTGKSHLLESLERAALSAGCVCSRIVISKETPLYDLGKVYRAAADHAIVPGQTGQAIPEIAQMLLPKSERYKEFYLWANSTESGLPALFPASLFLHERLSGDLELVENVTAFWAGDRISLSRVKQGLKQADAVGMFDVKAVPVRELGAHRFAFASRLMFAAGFSGWVLLIDEVELIGRYSPLQRGKSYAEFARWMGDIGGPGIGGVTTVLAITDDFALLVLQEKSDRDTIPAKLRSKHGTEYAAIANHAEVGMEAIERESIALAPPDEGSLARTYGRLKEIHGSAYRWSPPDLSIGERSIQRPMRSYVRRWISEWDLRRLYPDAEVNLEEKKITTDYAEDRDLQVAGKEEEAN